MKNPYPLPVLVAFLGSVLAGQVTAQNFTGLHHFSYDDDGALPIAGLVLSGNLLYGTTRWGGGLGGGTVFAINTDGRGYATLHSFGSYVAALELQMDEPPRGTLK